MTKLKFFFFLLSALLVSGNVCGDTSDYLCFTANEAGSTVKIVVAGNAPTKTYLNYSINGGTWRSCNLNTIASGKSFSYTLANAGDKIYFTAASGSQGSNPGTADYKAFSVSMQKYWYFQITGNVSVSGDIRTLYSNQSPTTIPAYCFYRLFQNCTGLVDASELKLSATSLGNSAYRAMFIGCTNLEKAPALPATDFVNNVSTSCYYSMFEGCEALKIAPKLPAAGRLLKDSCYCRMFYGCTSLTTAPTLPALYIYKGSYQSMFYGCKNLNYIHTLATSKNAGYQTTDWVYKVASTGIFVKDATATFWEVDSSRGIPKGWTVVTMPSVGANPLCFTAAVAGAKIQLKKNGSLGNVTLWYSTDKKIWDIYTLGTDVVLSNAGDKVYFSAGSTDNAKFSTSSSNYYQFIMTGEIAASGNIMSLLNAACTSTTIPCDYCFYGLFSGCTSLTTAPELPAPTLTAHCYDNMFYNCSNLNSINCSATTTTIGEGYTTSWTHGVVTSDGNFIGAEGVDWPAGENGNPWIVVPTTQTQKPAAWDNDNVLIETVTSATEYRIILEETGEQIADGDLSQYAIDDCGTYNINLSDAKLQNYVGKTIMIEFLTDDNTWTKVNTLKVPLIVKTVTSTSNLVVSSSDIDLWVGTGASLTIGKTNNTFKSVYVTPGAKLIIPQDSTLTCDTLALRSGGITKDGNNTEYQFDYPQLVVDGSISAGAKVFDILLNDAQYYAFSLPYDVDISKATFLDGTSAASSFASKYYDSEGRANGNKKNWKFNWYKGQTGYSSILKADSGYSVFVMPQTIQMSGASTSGRRAYSYVRFPLTISNWTGETSTSNKYVTVKEYAGKYECNSGWNYIGNPYLADYGPKSIYIIKSDNSKQYLNYVTIRDNDGQSYTQLTPEEATLSACRSFFVQVPCAGQLYFTRSTSNSASLRALEVPVMEEIMAGVRLSNATYEDHMGILIGSDYTAEYEINADLSKWQSAGISIYAQYGGYDLTVAAISESEATNSIPLVVKTNAAGTYTFDLSTRWQRNTEDLEHLYLYDASTSAYTDLLTSTYSFDANAATTITDRFYLSAIRTKVDNATDMESTYSHGKEPWVISGHGHLSVGGAVADGMVTIYSATGAMVYQGAAEANRPIVLPQGMYVVKVSQDGATYTNNGIVY